MLKNIDYVSLLKYSYFTLQGHEIVSPVCSNCGLQPYTTNLANDDQIDELIRNLPYGSGMRGKTITSID